MRNKVFALIVVLVLASMVLASCATPTPETVEVVKTVVVEKEGQTVVITATPEPAQPEPVEAPVMRVNLGSFPDMVDPQKSSFVNEIAHLKLIYEGLTRLDENLDTVAGAAESWEYNDDATNLTFTLRKDLKYSDGSLLNAARFHYSIMRNINPETLGEYASITDEIIGAAEWRDGTGAAEGVGIHAKDTAGNICDGDYENADCIVLDIQLKQPAPYFHTVMSLWVTFPAKQELIEEGGDIWWLSSKYHIGNGPFVVQTLEPFVRSYYTPNANYWRGVAKYDIEFRYITEGAVAFEAYKNDEFDVVGLGAEDLSTVQSDTELNKQANIYPGSCTYAFYMNKNKPPFDDAKVREAFSYGTDRQAWVTDILKGLGSPTLTWIPKGFPGYDETEDRWPYDLEKAKATIAESTYGSFEALPEITLTFSGTARNKARFEWLANQWTTNLGVKIKLDPVEPTAYTALTKELETLPQVFYLGWCADYPDPQNWLSVYWMTTSSFAARYAYSNPDMDALMQEADKTLDPEKRADLYLQAQKLLVGDAAVIMMVNNVNSYLMKPWIKGAKLTPMDAGWPGDIDPLSITIEK